MAIDRFSTHTIRGHVIAKWVGNSELPAYDTHNTLSYSAADALAAAYGGDSSYIPKYIGFIYSDNQDAVLPPISRDMNISSVKEEVESIRGNMLVVRFSRKPTISNDSADGSNDSPYVGNTVTFHAVTRSGVDGIYFDDTTGDSQYAGQLTAGKTLHRAVLLGDGSNLCDANDRYTVLAMVDLKKNGKYRQKPADYELALDWRVTFE